jgi:hypothetical protein
VTPADVFCTHQVYTLEKVLKLRKDHVTQVEFLDEAMQVGGLNASYASALVAETSFRISRKSQL